MTDSDPWDAWADEYGQGQFLRRRQPSKAAAKRRWHSEVLTELDELGDLYGVSPDVVKGAI
ncbi:hypothetical protein OG393_29265 [Streptomyces sp. NBC_01216]|uniref:hypothetical protein n=1 Tax=Streptomyces sp. NBC_01216 TaxID=2903778 RepID=UPI002E0E015A|nr:hypothetical protein OG393_29265 [Streptomyces sp. NBC_01216]